MLVRSSGWESSKRAALQFPTSSHALMAALKLILQVGFWAQGLGFRVQSLGFRVQSLGFRVYGEKTRIKLGEIPAAGIA